MSAHKRNLKSDTLITPNKYKNKSEDIEIIANVYNPILDLKL